MFRILTCLLLTTTIWLSSFASQAASEPTPVEPPTEWDTYYVVMLKEGPEFAAERSAESLQALMNDHIQYQLRLQESGQALASGGFGQVKEGMVGLTLLAVGSQAEAERIAKDDPAVADGRFAAIVHEWYVPAGRL